MSEKKKWFQWDDHKKQIAHCIRKLMQNGIIVKNNTIYIGGINQGRKLVFKDSIVGIKTYAKLDYLVKQHGYTVIDNRSLRSTYQGQYI